jgi:lipopolysaccharide heptosyltransferase II
VEKVLALARALNWPCDPPSFPLGISEAERVAAAELLREAAGRPISAFTAVAPGARWASKQWAPERYAQVIDALADEGETVVLLGAPDERALSQEILRHARHAPINLVGRTSLRGLAAVLELAERVICQDSGPMHIAAALGKPVVALFGPTSAERTGPFSPAARVLRVPLPCAPCYRRECPLGHHDCMRRIEPAAVIEAALAGAASSAPTEPRP